LRSLQDPDEEAPDDVFIFSADSDQEQLQEDEEEEKVEPTASEEWNVSAVLRQPPRMASHMTIGQPAQLPAAMTRLSLLQLFLTRDLLDTWAQLTHAAAGATWPPTDMYEIYIGVHWHASFHGH